MKKALTIEKTPDTVHTTRDTLTLPVFFRTPEGETNIPEPMMLPTMTVMPFIKVILGLRVISSSVLLSPSMFRAVLQEATTTLVEARVRRLNGTTPLARSRLELAAINNWTNPTYPLDSGRLASTGFRLGVGGRTAEKKFEAQFLIRSINACRNL